MDTPFLDQIGAVAGRGPRFFMPGHKGNAAALPFLGGMLRYDLTEVEGADELSRPRGALAQSQRNMAAAYGSGATLYSTAGSTSCILAMLALFVGAGGRVVMARGCHVAAARALALLDAAAHFVPLCEGRPRPQDIDAALGQSGAKAVYITSPDYYGRMADVAGIARVCAAHGAVLLVDNAHGAHLRFVKFPRGGGANAHPLAAGANACCDSAHKTLPCLTGAAMLHLKDASLAGAARDMLNLFCSTSPSYPVMLSLDWAAGLLCGNNKPDFEEVGLKLKRLAHKFEIICETCDDPLRLNLVPRAGGFQPEAFHAALLDGGIAPEFYDGERLVLMASPWNLPGDFKQLDAVLTHILHNLPYNGSIKGTCPPVATDAYTAKEPPKTVCTVRAALFGPQQRVPAHHAAGRVMAGLPVPCPPGAPLVLPGEEIDAGAAALYAQSGILMLPVVK